MGLGFGTFAALSEEPITEKVGAASMSSRTVTQMSRSFGCSRAKSSSASAPNCGRGDVVVIPGGTEHEVWFREDAEVIDFFAHPRDDFLLGGKPASMSDG